MQKLLFCRRNLKIQPLLFAAVLAATEGLPDRSAKGDAYDPPSTYYAAATGTGTTLKHNLYGIIKTGFVQHTYGDARYTLDQLWADPTNSSKLILLYTQNSVTGAWDNGVTWNREHIIPEYTLGISGIQNSNSTYGADEFDLAPTNPNVNSTRSNYAYGYTGSTSTPSGTTYGKVTGTDGVTYWNAGPLFDGDAARSVFYMVTRYGEGQGAGSAEPKNAYNLTVSNGTLNNAGKMGDLNTLLHWAYEDPVDTFERRKNQLVYAGLTSVNVSGGASGAASQGNRNPYIDHPEYIWAVFGTSANNSQISVGSNVASDGSSNAVVNLGSAIAGSSFSTSNVVVNKSGSTPTTFNVSASGSATTTLLGTGETFNYSAGTKTMAVGLVAPSTPGNVSGTVTIDNTDLTTAANGNGSADGDDLVAITGTAVDHSNASFSLSADTDRLTLSFGSFAQNSGVHTLNFSVADLLSASGFTAGLDLDGILGTGSVSALYTNLGAFTGLTAGSASGYLADFSTSTLGNFTAEYTLMNSDENIPGATNGSSLILELTGTVTAVPEPTSLTMLTILGISLSRRRRSA